MSPHIDRSSLLDDVLERLSGNGVDFAQNRADAVLGRASATPTITLSRTLTRVRSINLERERSVKKYSRVWDWYRQLNPPPQLTAEQHVEFAKKVEIGVLAEDRLINAPSGTLSLTEIRELRFLQTQGQRAFASLVTHNLRLVFNWAKPYRDSVSADEVQDAFQAGVLGLIRGLQGWDYKLGFALSTYVSSSIRQSIQRWRENESLVVRVPSQLWTSLSNAGYKRRHQGAAELFEIDDGRMVESQVEVTEEGEGLSAAIRAFTAESYETLSRAIEDEFSTLDAEDFQRFFTQRSIEKLLDNLSEREAGTLRMRFGLGDGTPHTLEDIGWTFGVTRERIRQIANKAMFRLAILVVTKNFKSASDFADVVGRENAGQEFWDWMAVAFGAPNVLPKGSQHQKTLMGLLQFLPRQDTNLA